MTPETDAVRTLLRTERGTLEVAHTPDILLDGVSLDLPRLQARLLLALLDAREPMARSELAAVVWRGRAVAEHTVHSQITLLRRRVEDLGLSIYNVRGRGYVISEVGKLKRASVPNLDSI